MKDSTRAAAEAQVANTPSVDLILKNRMKIADGTDPQQVCRTCIYDLRRLHGKTAIEVLQYRKAGGDVNELKCQPTKVANQIYIYSSGVQRPVNADGSIPVKLTKKTDGVVKGRAESCGQQLQDKCKNCRRLVPEVVDVIGGYNSNGKPWKRQVTVGGHCSIPAEGIMVDGKKVLCDRKPITREENIGSCFTCGNCQTFTGAWANEYPTITRIDLTSYEMERTRLMADPDEVGLAIWSARQEIGTAPWPISFNTPIRNSAVYGLVKFFEADVIEVIKAPTYKVVEPGEHRRVHTFFTTRDGGASAWLAWGQYLWDDKEAFLSKYREENPNRKVITDNDPEGDRIKLAKEPVVEQVGEYISGYKVRFRGSGVIAEFDVNGSDDTKGIIHATSNPGKVILEILSPWHRQYGLPDTTRVSRRIYPRVDCEVCKATGEITTGLQSFGPKKVDCYACKGVGKVVDWPKNRVRQVGREQQPPKASCNICTTYQACSAHARGLHMVESEDGVDYEFPWPQGDMLARFKGKDAAQKRKKFMSERKKALDASRAEIDPRFRLHWDDIQGKILDGNDQVPHIAVFRTQLRGLLQVHKDNWRSILRQFGEMERVLEMSKPRTVNLGLGSFMGVEAGKPYCTLNMHDPNKGLNLREIFGDWFGEPRSARTTNPMYDRIDHGQVRGDDMRASTSYFSWQQEMELADWQRVTNPGERIQEENVRNEHQLRAHRRGMPGFDHLGNRLEQFMMPDDPDVESLPVGDVAETTADYVAWLDELVEVPISETGESLMVSHRWLRHGYEIKGRTGANKKRKTSAMQADVEVVKFNHDADPNETGDRMIGFLCTAPSCGATYSVDEINDPENPTCTKVTYFNEETDEVRVCDAPLRWDEQDREWEQGHTKMTGDINPDEPYRRVGSPLLAGGPNSRRWQQDERLLRTGCDSWRPKPWVRRSYQRIAAPSSNINRQELNHSDWAGRKLTVEVEGEKMEFTLGVNISFEAALVQAVLRANGESTVRYMGGNNVPMTAKILELS